MTKTQQAADQPQQFSEQDNWKQEIAEATEAVLAEARMEDQEHDPTDEDEVRATLERVAAWSGIYYVSLLGAGLPDQLAATLLFEWHNLFWQSGLPRGSSNG